MTGRRLRVGVAATALTVAACRSMDPNEGDGTACPQTREFGNYGCARFIAVLTWYVAPPTRDTVPMRIVAADDAEMARAGFA
jgi:hypothetical protein